MTETVSKPLTLQELEALEDQDGLRYERWDGQPVAMTGGTRAHNLIALGLRDVLKSQLPRQCDVFVADMALRFSPDASSDQAYPDVMVVCGAERGTYQAKPVLVAEVLSESSVSRDRKRKFKAYTRLDSVEAYFILSQTAIEVEVYRRASGWEEEIYRGGEAVIELSRPALRLPLRQIYDEVWDDLVGPEPIQRMPP
jgi:Uma2 family endonuclease